jgi:hypothetical protein
MQLSDYRILTDENINPKTVQFLRAKGFDNCKTPQYLAIFFYLRLY